MVFGKLIDGVLVVKKYSTPIIIDGVSYITGDEGLCRKAGYKEVVYVEPTPDSGYDAISCDWEETDTQLIQTWNYVEHIEPEIEKSELEIQVEEMSSTIDMLTECILEMSAMIYA